MAPKPPARAKPAAAALARSGGVDRGEPRPFSALPFYSPVKGKGRKRPAPRGALDFGLFYGVPENGQKGANHNGNSSTR